MNEFTRARQTMLDKQLIPRGIRDRAVLAALNLVPREQFVAPEMAPHAYRDSPLNIPEQQTISQPYVVALMAQALELHSQCNVLEVGAGSGYAAAVLSQIAREVHAVERHPKLANEARLVLKRLGYTNVSIHQADGSQGWPGRAPYDAIAVAAAAPSIPTSLRQQLKVGGRLVIPVGPRDEQTLIRLRRLDFNDYREESLGKVRFVPLIGREGWS
ncbi:MAG: protein-L-isoaspartate(D-aspartate) O-methyltransferase [Candidatus Eremiobacteraeota bacterium]|nr:protein-L-isoaspartate(D-aspartate) O-methyltransferase [Candidatus Eremiobacteraeota bacterium]